MPTVRVDTASSGDNTLVAAVAGKRYKVLGWNLASAAAHNVTFKSGSSTELFGPIEISATCPNVAPVTEPGYPWFLTDAGEALVLNLEGNNLTGGGVVYEVCDA